MNPTTDMIDAAKPDGIEATHVTKGKVRLTGYHYLRHVSSPIFVDDTGDVEGRAEDFECEWDGFVHNGKGYLVPEIPQNALSLEERRSMLCNAARCENVDCHQCIFRGENIEAFAVWEVAHDRMIQAARGEG